MSILETILKANSGGLVKQVAGSLNLKESQAGTAIAQLLPALTEGMKKNVEKPNGLEALLGAIQSGGHDRYVDRAEQVVAEDAITDGNGILAHLLGSKDVSRKVASEAAASTGLDASVLKKMLPMVATMAMGTLSKESKGGALSALLGGGQQQSPAASLLGAFLDKDNDKSAVDGLLGLAKRFL